MRKDTDDFKNIVLPDYPDIVPKHPGWTEEDYERFIAEEQKKVEDMTEWPEI